MSGDSFRDPELQRAAAGQPLANVPTIYSFRKPEQDWIGWLFDELMPVRPDACVLDVGCGPGPYVPVARRRAHGGFVVPLDISIDRLTAVEPPGRVLADVVRLPLADGSVASLSRCTCCTTYPTFTPGCGKSGGCYARAACSMR